MAGAGGGVFQNAEQGSKLCECNTKFAFNLYKKTAESTNGNIFMSPLSISVALAMTYQGAKGNTMAQMKDVLHFGEVGEAHLHQSFSDIRSALNRPDQPYKLHMANRLFGEKTYHFLEEFLAEGRKHYGAEIAAVDFQGNCAGATAEVNKWVEGMTENLIKEIVPESAVNSLTKLILVNAVYFKGDWLKQFNKAKTNKLDFLVSANETVKVHLMSMMEAKLNCGVKHEWNCQALELPYSGNALSMFILLPDRSPGSLAALESKITAHALTNVTEVFSMQQGEVNVWLPRFKLDERLSLAKTLKSMGINDLFTDGAADLSGVDGSKALYVSEVLHRAVVDVNEEGTEAAAATAVVMKMRCAMVKKSFDFRADHPFLFFIRDNQTKSILFLGRLQKPDAAE